MNVIKIALAAMALLPQAPQFEVASIHRSPSDGISEFQIRGDRLLIYGMSVRDLVRRAYMGSDAPQDQDRVVGGPDWAATELYDISATIDGDLRVDPQGRPTRLLAMLKTLLEDRFKLRVHTEPRDTSLYQLVVATKNSQPAPGLRPSTRNCPVYAQGVPRPPVDPDQRCGVTTQTAGTRVTVTGQGVTLGELATRLQGFRSVGRPVQNRTNLEGRYDFTFEFTGTPPPGAGETAAAPADTGASLFTAIQDQLGLKLQADRGPMEVYVIDAVQRPTEN